MNKSHNTNGAGFLCLLTLLFIGLKLGGVISWPWWWVLAPLWGGVIVGIVVLAIVFLYLLYLVK